MDQDKRRRWYSISVDTLRASVIPVMLLLVLAVGYTVYRSWQRQWVEEEAAAVIGQVGTMIQRFPNQDVQTRFSNEYGTAWDDFQEARRHYAVEDYPKALASARRSLNMLLNIRAALENRDALGDAQFVALQGHVEYRSATGGGWKEAHNRITLRAGDYVRTGSSGSAEIFFHDSGILFTMRPDTQVAISRGRTADGRGNTQTMKMEYGWVDLSTSNRPGGVSTPAAEAQVAEDSEASVAWDRASNVGRFASFRGEMEVQGSDGEQRQVGERQVVVQSRRGLSQPQDLPGRPTLVAPVDRLELRSDETEQLALGWNGVSGARRYALQVSSNHLFVDNVIDVKNRSTTQATLGIQGEGNFFWRVAGIGANDGLGQWSTPRRFRISSSLADQDLDVDDTTPPELSITDVTPYGNIFIVKGRTEAGALVSINGEPVKVAANGTFTKAVQLTTEGRTLLDVRSRDVRGNESSLSHPVFVEGP